MPTLLLTFAANKLPAVHSEADKTWKSVEDHAKIKAIKLEDVDIEELTDAIIDHHADLFFFHFGGHASQHKVVLDSFKDLDKIRFARLLMPREKHQLQWVFLNGCSSYGHVGLLTAKGVKAIIATNVEVSDVTAARLATYFYKCFFAKGFTLKEAFQTAEATVSGKNAHTVIVNPGEIDEEQPMPSNWTLFVHHTYKEVLDWTLEDFLQKGSTNSAIDNKAILELLDTDLVAAFAKLDTLDWGNQRGLYLDLKNQYQDMPVGSSMNSLRNRLKVFVGSQLNK